MVPFAGFSMPVQYTGITDEHLAVRKAVGVFDISHMGQFLASGPEARRWLNGLLTNDVLKLESGQGQYTLLLNDHGGVIDDLILYRMEDDEFLLVVNASKISEDFSWMSAHLADGVKLQNLSEDFAGMAVQGPDAAELYESLCGSALPLPPRNGIGSFNTEAGRVIVCRTGYTGEDGFEFFCPAAAGERWLERMITLGAKPCGLGARDTLRLEMGYPLNGNDLSPDKTPLEAGLGFFVDLNKNFVGQEVLLKQKATGLPTKLCAVLQTEKGPPLRAHYPVLADGEVIGELCSGGVSPSLGSGIGMAYLPAAHSALGTRLEIDIRGRRFAAEIVKKPFYKKA